MAGAAVTEVNARAVILRGGRLLVARAVSQPWCFLPGGHVVPGEPVESALTRQIAEELGTVAQVGDFAGRGRARLRA